MSENKYIEIFKDMTDTDLRIQMAQSKTQLSQLQQKANYFITRNIDASELETSILNLENKIELLNRFML